MSDLRTAAQQALEALEKLVVGSEYEESVEAERAMDALKTALAESERDWSLLEATQESLRDHMEEIHRLRGEMAAPVQEPVAWLRLRDGKLWHNDGGNFGDDWMPLYTAPPQRKPLTRKGALAIVDAQEAYRKTGLPMFYRDQAYNMIRAVERAHGIGGQDEP